ncbi:hypothetical protein PGB90_001530 [Kerria lacca]
MAAVEIPTNLGHSFVKKTFHRPTYCHNCTDMLWGLMQQGSVCEGKTEKRLKFSSHGNPHKYMRFNWNVIELISNELFEQRINYF